MTPGVNNEQYFSDFFSSMFGGAGRHKRSATGEPFNTRGRDLEVDMPISLKDTLSEESKQISFNLPHYDANGRRLEDVTKNLKIKILKGTRDGERIRLKGQGTHGDLYAILKVVMPPITDDKDKAIWQQLADGHTFNPRADWS